MPNPSDGGKAFDSSLGNDLNALVIAGRSLHKHAKAQTLHFTSASPKIGSTHSTGLVVIACLLKHLSAEDSLRARGQPGTWRIFLSLLEHSIPQMINNRNMLCNCGHLLRLVTRCKFFHMQRRLDFVLCCAISAFEVLGMPSPAASWDWSRSKSVGSISCQKTSLSFLHHTAVTSI